MVYELPERMEKCPAPVLAEIFPETVWIVIPPLNQKFKVTHPRFPEFSLIATLIKIRPGDDPFRKYTIERTRREDIYNNVDTKVSISEVDEDWFNEKLTGRKITLL